MASCGRCERPRDAWSRAPHSGGFVVELESDLTHRADTELFHYAELPAACPDERCPVTPTGISIGPGGTTVISGMFESSVELGTLRRSNGGNDVFLVRLAR